MANLTPEQIKAQQAGLLAELTNPGSSQTVAEEEDKPWYMDIWDSVTGSDDGSSWLDSILDFTTDGGVGSTVTAGGLGLLAKELGLFDSPEQRPSGYQGGIPEYTFNRQQTNPYDPNRRPGSGGRRYFTDAQYIPQGGQVPQVPQGDATIMPVATEPSSSTEGITSLPDTKLTAQAPQQPPPPSRDVMPREEPEVQAFEEGGIASVREGKYLRGETDGMADEIPASIDNKEPALLSDGEFVIPADIVSHLGNGNSEAGAKELEKMMARIRKERTGNDKQGKEIDPREMLIA